MNTSPYHVRAVTAQRRPPPSGAAAASAYLVEAKILPVVRLRRGARFSDAVLETAPKYLAPPFAHTLQQAIESMRFNS